MFKKICARLFKKGQKAGHLFLLGSLFSCSSGPAKRLTLQQAQSRGILKMEMMRLWAKAEYRRMLGDELGAQALERDLEMVEKEIESYQEEALSSTSL